MQEKLIQWYFKPELSLELNFSLSLQTIGQNVLPSKKLSGQNLYLSRHCPLTNVPVLMCLNIFFFKAQDDDVEDMMEYATSGEFVL